MWKENILETIGNTPLIKINNITKELPCTVLAKVEYFNPGNSVKDRMALKMVEVAEKEGKLKPGGTIIEGTSGNTGMGLAMAAIIKGYKCIFTSTDKQSKEKFDILRALGAEVIVCPTDVAPDDPRSYYSVSKRLSEEIPNSWYVNQYDNLANRLAHYESTGPEIWEQTEGKITHLVVASGTGGTVTGAGKFLKEQNPDIQVWAIDSYGSLLKKYFDTGEIDHNEVYPYISEGFGEDFVPANYDMQYIDLFEKVADKEGAVMTRRIAKEEGIFVGYSAGSCLQGVMQLKDQLKPDDVVVCIFHDHGSRYVGKVYNDEWMMQHHFLDVRTIGNIISGRGSRKLITIEETQPISDALDVMKKYQIANLPVKKGNIFTGSLSQAKLFSLISDTPTIRGKNISEVMDAPYQLLPADTDVQDLCKIITNGASAVLSKDVLGDYHIITQYDLVQSLAK